MAPKPLKKVAAAAKPSPESSPTLPYVLLFTATQHSDPRPSGSALGPLPPLTTNVGQGYPLCSELLRPLQMALLLSTIRPRCPPCAAAAARILAYRSNRYTSSMYTLIDEVVGRWEGGVEKKGENKERKKRGGSERVLR